jgi:hypothetical protein
MTMDLFDRLIENGYPRDSAGRLATDIGDMREGLTEIERLLTSKDVEHKMRHQLVEEECELHIAGHLESLRKEAHRLRKASP